MKIQLRSTKTGMKSGSLKRVAKALSQLLGYKIYRTINSRKTRKQFVYGDVVNKLEQYKFFQKENLSALEFTTSQEQAKQWVSDGYTVFGRKLLSASCGKGIEVYEGEVIVSPCPVYTKYKPKKREFRVHVFKDKVVTIVEKRLKKDWKGATNHKIRNLANGYIFCQDFQLTGGLRDRVVQLALSASKVCTSDFRGVDLGYNEKHDDLFVIEVNSAPGIEGSNVNKYVEVIKSYA
jgi:hypothetical protein